MRRQARALLMVPILLLTGLAGCLGGGETLSDESPEDAIKASGQKAPPVEPGQYKFDADYAQVLAQGQYTERQPVLYTEAVSPVDGAAMPIAVWRPVVPDDVKLPIIVDAGPYYTTDLRNDYRGHISRLGENFLSHGYAVAAVTVRGTANHGGCMDLMGPDERADLDAGISWLGSQDWSNGNVAMIGASYDGSTPFEVASMGNPYLKTIVPVSGLTDIYGLMYRNGTSESRGPIVLNALYYAFWTPAFSNGREADRVIQGAVCPASWEGFAASAWSGGGLGRDANGYWDDRDSRPGLIANYKGSILHVQGLQDWNVDPSLQMPWIDIYARNNGITLHQWLGQWGHAFPDSYCSAQNPDDYRCRWDYANYMLKWFDFYLKGIETVNLGQAVQVQDQDGRWRTEANWPPLDRDLMPLELATPGVLVPLGEGQTGEVRLQPNPFGSEDDARQTLPMQGYADFSSGPMTQDYQIAGLPKVHVTVVPEGPGGTLAAWLYRKDAEGLTRIGWTAMNLLYADGTENPTPVVPGAPLVAKMQIQPMDALVRQGEELVLRVWAYPPTDRVANAAAGTINLQLGGQQSTIELPVVLRPEESFFEVPFPVA